MTTIVIAAHNEAAVIGRCLDALLADHDPDLEIIVVPNGCTDETAELARSRGVRVVDVASAGKAMALNAGDAVATSFPRIYLDADIAVPPGGIHALVAALARTGSPVAVPRRRLALRGRPRLVRAYFSINARLPVFSRGLFGRGLVALSEEGRRRFDSFPPIVADDLFLDSLFADSERTIVDAVEVVVETPLTAHDLISVLARVRRGNAAVRALGDAKIRQARRWSWLWDVVLRDPRLAPAAVVYVTLSVVAVLRARRTDRFSLAWGRDESTRPSERQSQPRPECR